MTQKTFVRDFQEMTLSFHLASSTFELVTRVTPRENKRAYVNTMLTVAPKNDSATNWEKAQRMKINIQDILSFIDFYKGRTSELSLIHTFEKDGTKLTKILTIKKDDKSNSYHLNISTKEKNEKVYFNLKPAQLDLIAQHLIKSTTIIA